MRPNGKLSFGQDEFDMLCTTIQETGRGTVSVLAAGSEAMALDILRDAAHQLGIGLAAYDVAAYNGQATLIVRGKSS